MKKNQTLEDLRKEGLVEYYVHTDPKRLKDRLESKGLSLKTPHRYITIAGLKFPDMEETSVGFTICNTEKDQYRRKVGNSIAVGRAMKNPYKTLEKATKKEIVTQLLTILEELEDKVYTNNFSEIDFLFPPKRE